MTERDPDTIYVDHGPIPYVRVKAAYIPGRLTNGVIIELLQGAKGQNSLVFSHDGAMQLNRLIERKRIEGPRKEKENPS